MKKLFTFLLLLSILNVYGQTYEDFEPTAKLVWNTFNGATFTTINNPDTTGNKSAKVGKLVNSATSDFNFILGDLTAAADLSKRNIIKMKVWAPIACKVLFKMEGGGKAVEKIVDVPATKKWVDMSFDLSAGASFTTLNKILVSFNPFTVAPKDSFYIDDIRGVESGTIFETFETGNEMGWKAFDGTLDAPVANPAPNSVNRTAKVGKYTKSDKHAYSLLMADRGTNTFDFSIDNQLKLQIHANQATQVLVKLEGPGGPAFEKIANIGITNTWQEYTFDFSAAKAAKHLTKAILFFDPGVDTSKGVYHFDNFRAESQGVCDGKTPDPKIIDDFECNRNATYVNGWDSLTVVNNPAKGGTNNSDKVGRYVDPQGEEWAALLVDYQDKIDLSKNNQFNIKIRSTKPSKFLAKLEGGTSPAKETAVTITEVNSWVTYTVDFSDQAAANHKKVVIFFNHGTLPAAGDVYHIDDLSWSEKVDVSLETFENGAALPWEPLDQLAIHGKFEVANNPASGGVNTSAKVGKYTKGTSTFSTVAAVAPGKIDLSAKPQFNLDVWTPAGTTNVTMVLESVSNGNKEVTRDIKNAGNWETLSFNFAAFQAVKDWTSIKILFNPSKAESGKIFYFDNLKQSLPTVDPCENTVAIANIMDDFECQRNAAFGVGKDLITVVNNPNNVGNASTKVGLYKDQPNEPWGALCKDFVNPLNLSLFNQMEVQVLSGITAPVLFKLEGGTSPAKEVWTEIKETNKWTTLTADFSSVATGNFKRACFFFNGGVTTNKVDDYYVDNMKFARAPLASCLMNFDNGPFTSTKWNYFPAENSGGFEVVNNPKPGGINTSAKVGKAIEKASGEQPWQGMFTDLDAYMDFPTNRIIKMKVLSPKVGAITMKVERPLVAGFPGQSGDNTVRNTKANEWEDLTFDFSSSPTPIDEKGQYMRITLIWDIENLPTADVLYYFDDVRMDGTSCNLGTGLFSQELESMSIAPNPVNSLLRISNTEQVSKIEVYNMFGQRIATIGNTNASDIQVDVTNLVNGHYSIMAYDQEGVRKAQARFIKM
jgi:hypothetical protein